MWGIDLRWVNVPDGTTDFTFMKDWNIASDVRDVRAGLAVARLVRWFGGHEDGRMNLRGGGRRARQHVGRPGRRRPGSPLDHGPG